MCRCVSENGGGFGNCAVSLGKIRPSGISPTATAKTRRTLARSSSGRLPDPSVLDPNPTTAARHPGTPPKPIKIYQSRWQPHATSNPGHCFWNLPAPLARVPHRTRETKEISGTTSHPCQEWSECWADRHSSADFIAICDSDVVFHTFGLPQLMFQPPAAGPRVSTWFPGAAGFKGELSSVEVMVKGTYGESQGRVRPSYAET